MMTDTPHDIPDAPGPHDTPTASGPRRYRVDLAYDGARFSGWARQPGLRTVQGELELWLGRILHAPVELTVAGRTDAGVHARRQVAHFDYDGGLNPDELAARLRRVLPEDIVVTGVGVAPPCFDARFAAVWRRYVYRLWDADSRPDPLRRFDVCRIGDRLDVGLMNRAGELLLGLRDFAPFCKHREGATTIRTLLEARTVRLDDSCATIATTVRADAFCHSMVRSLMGALTSVGSGRRDLAWLADVMRSPTRHSAVPVMPALGLTLEEVGYPADAELAARVETARAVRTLPSDAGVPANPEPTKEDA